MNMIRPVSDLRNNFADISKTVHETAQPVFLTKNGYGDMVIMSMETYEKNMRKYLKYKDIEVSEKEIEEGKAAGGRERGGADGSTLFFQRCAEGNERCHWRGTGCIN